MLWFFCVKKVKLKKFLKLQKNDVGMSNIENINIYLFRPFVNLW
jgi:hypothetical protein